MILTSTLATSDTSTAILEQSMLRRGTPSQSSMMALRKAANQMPCSQLHLQ